MSPSVAREEVSREATALVTTIIAAASLSAPAGLYLLVELAYIGICIFKVFRLTFGKAFNQDIVRDV